MTDINDLMDLDPFTCTHADVTQLIEIVKQGRATFNLMAKDPTSKAARAKSKLDAPKVKLDLSTLLKKKL